MELYKSDGLSGYQNFHRKVFEAPQGSLAHWGVKKIENFYRNERIVYHPIWAHTARRVIALAMPLFALLDVFHYVAISAFKIVTLKPRDSGYALLKCLKSLQLFLCAVPSLLVGVIEPKLLYRTEGMWLDVQKVRVRSQITHHFEKRSKASEEGKTQVDHLQGTLEKAIEEMVTQEDAVKLLKRVLQKVISEIPTDEPEKQEIIIEQYIEMFSELLVCSANQNVELNNLTDHFTEILELIIKMRHPLLRLSLIERLLTTAKNHPDIYEDIALRDYTNFSRQALPYLVARLITDDEDILGRVLEVSNDSFFKNRANQTDFLATLHEIYESDFSGKDQERALTLLLDCFELDNQIVEANKPVPKKKGIPSNEEERSRLIVEKERAIDEKRARIRGTEKSKRNDFKLCQQIEKLEAELTVLREMKLLSEVERQDLQKKDKGKNGHYLAAKDILRMLLSIEDRSLVSKCLSRVEKGNQYSHLSDQQIVTDVFIEVFEIKDVPDDAFQKIKELRAPWALVAFHSRMVGAKSKQREQLIASSKTVVESLLKGTYNELRHETENNPNLKKVFEAKPELKKKWMAPSQNRTVGDLYPGASKRFAQYRVIDSTDPSDILLIGNDTHTCVHLGGRIQRVMGLSAFIRDGKIHSLLVKDDEGKTVGETQLQLMWDGKSRKPVLFVEQANFAGAENGDYSVEHALYNYARKRAEELGLDLTTTYVMKDPKGMLQSKNKYPGKVGSLGSSSPVEYVNRYHKNYSKPYDLGQTYLVAAV